MTPRYKYFGRTSEGHKPGLDVYSCKRRFCCIQKKTPKNPVYVYVSLCSCDFTRASYTLQCTLSCDIMRFLLNRNVDLTTLWSYLLLWFSGCKFDWSCPMGMPSWDVPSVLEYRVLSACVQETLSATIYSYMDNPAHIVLLILLPQRLKNSNGWNTLYVLYHFCDLRNVTIAFPTQCRIWCNNSIFATSPGITNA